MSDTTGGWRPYDSRPEVIEARLREERARMNAVETIRWRSENPDARPVGYYRAPTPPPAPEPPAPSKPKTVPRIVNLARKPEPEPVPQPPRRSSRSSRQPRQPRQPRHLSGEALASIDGLPIHLSANEVERIAREAVRDL